MTIKVADLMVENVIYATKHETVAHVKAKISKNKIHAVPIIGDDEEVLGIISSTDLLGDISDTTPVSQVMTDKVYKIPQY